MTSLSEPPADGAPGATRWAAYLDWLRDDLARAVLALSPEGQRASSVPSGWAPIEMLSHCLHMEQRWFVWGFLGEEVDDPWGDWSQPEPWTADDSDEVEPGARWQVPSGVTAEALVERLHAIGARTTAILREHGLDTQAAPGPRFEDGTPPDLEWICFHVFFEYSRHLGQLDVAVEITPPRN